MLGDGDGGIDDVAADGASLTAEQRLVLQAVYDHFQKHASWPTFITIDRPLRRTHGFDTAAIFLSLPDSLVVEPRPGGLRPIANDELRLRLPGIQACAGGDVDTERFVRLLRRLAQEEVEFEPEAGDPPEMLQVTAGEVAEHLGLDQADHIGLGRLFAMLQLDNWGLAGSGSDDDDWYVWISPDIWRFRDVQTVEDCVRARDAWTSEARAALTGATDGAAPEYFHVRLSGKSESRDEVQLDLSREDLETRILAQYRAGRPIVNKGIVVPIDDLAQVSIVRTERSYGDLRRLGRKSLVDRVADSRVMDWGLVVGAGASVTDEFITEPPGSTTMPVRVATLPLPTARHISEDIVSAIRGKAGKSELDVAKLLALAEEL